jgi:proline racemase
MAVDADRDLIAPGAHRAFAGASGIPFHSELLAEERLGRYRAWRVRVAGTASFHGTATWTVEADDTLGDGFAIDDASPLPSAVVPSAADEG